MIEPDRPFTFPDQPPLTLIEALQRGDCVLFGGCRLSEDAGYPTWDELIRRLSGWSLEQEIIDRRTHDSNLKSIEAGSAEFVADSIATQAKKMGRQADLARFLGSVFRDLPEDLPQLHKTLAELPFSAVLTPTYDDLLEQAFTAQLQGQDPRPVYTSLEGPTTLEELRGRHAKHSFFMIKLRGQLARPESIIMSQAQYQDTISSSQSYADLAAGLFLSRTFLFVGSSLDEILRFVEPLRTSESKQEHYALIATREQGWEQKAASLKRRYNIRVFAFRAAQRHEESRRLIALAPQLTGELLQHGLTAVLAIREGRDRAWALAALAPQLTGELLQQGLTAAVAITDGFGRAEALTALAPQLTGPAHEQALQQGLAAALAIKEGRDQVWALAALMPQLTGPAREQALEQGLATALSIQQARDRVWALAALAPHLTGEAREQVLKQGLEVALTIQDEHARAQALLGLTPELTGELLQRGLTATLAIGGDKDRALVFAALAPQLTSPAREQASEQVLAAMLAIKDEKDRTEALVALAPQLTGELLLQGLAAALAIGDERDRARALAALAPQLTGELLQQGLMAALAIRDEYARALALAALAPQLTGSTREKASEQGLAATLAIGDERDRARALAALAPQLTGELLQLALAAARAIREGRDRAWALAALTPQLTGETREQALREGLAAAQDSDLVFLQGILEQVGSSSKGTAIQFGQSKTTWLASVRLENIGPFESLDLKLDRQWNILLGDNGVGKSNIIKAIAVGMLGRDAVSFADRIVRFGQNSGKITLETNEGKEYVTELMRTSSGIEIRTLPGKVLDIENWLVLGFPPVRTVTWQGITSPKLEPAYQRTQPDDLLPLVSGMPDPRLDSVKQWFVKIDYFRRSEPDGNYQQQLDEMARVIGQVTGGLKMDFKRVDLKAGRIYFETDDGEVPIDAVSQGTASLTGWVGFLTQRMFEMYPPKKDDLGKSISEYALVLIDEIDAHMHPGWQQMIVPRLSEIFSGVQFLATTHSPLVVANAVPESVFRLQRDAQNPHMIGIDQPNLDLRRWRADQVLTSPLFNLASTVNQETYQAQRRYTELSARSDLSPQEKKELAHFAALLEVRLPTPMETQLAREAFEKIEQSLDEKLKGMPAEKQKQLLEEAKVQVLENVTGSRRL